MKFNIQFTIGDDVPTTTDKEVRNQRDSRMTEALVGQMVGIVGRLAEKVFAGNPPWAPPKTDA